MPASFSGHLRRCRRLFGILALGVAALGCGDDEVSQVRPAPQPEAAAALHDAGPAPAADPEPSPQPAAGFHLDGDAIEYMPRSPRREAPRRRVIELVLRSTPPGATAAIDGVIVGTTPTYWSGEAEGKTHEFTFVKTGYSMARYRFVATQSGIVHGTLEPLVTDPPDAGLPPPSTP